jgi:hypothetical protein
MDAVMALWFCEIVGREVLTQGTRTTNFVKNEFLPIGSAQSRYVINLDDLAAASAPIRV